MSGHAHLALVLSGETAKFLSLCCSDSVNEVIEFPVLNPLFWFYMQLSFEKAVDLWDVNED